MLQFLASIIAPASELGKQYLANKAEKTKGEFNIARDKLRGLQAIAEAETEFRVAEWKAKADRAMRKDEMAFTLDEIAVREGAQTKWDEILSGVWLLVTTYYPVVIYPFLAFWLANAPLPSGTDIIRTLSDLPWFIQIVDFGIMARYLGLRGWFRDMKVGQHLKNMKEKLPLVGKKEADKPAEEAK